MNKLEPEIVFRNVDPEFTGDHRVTLTPVIDIEKIIGTDVGEELEFTKLDNGYNFCLSNDMCALSKGRVQIIPRLPTPIEGTTLQIIDKRRQVELLNFTANGPDDVNLMYDKLVETLRATGLTVAVDSSSDYDELYITNYTPDNVTLEIKLDLDPESVDIDGVFSFGGEVTVDTKVINNGTLSVRFCLTPFPTVKLNACPLNINKHNGVELDGMFDVFIDDTNVPYATNMTIEEMLEHFNEDHPKLWIREYVPPPMCVPTPSEWSNDISYDDLNHPFTDSNAVTLEMGYTGDYSHSYVNIAVPISTNLFDMFSGYLNYLEVREGTVEGTVQIRYLPGSQAVGDEFVGWESVEHTYVKNPNGHWTYSEYNVGNAGESVITLSNFFDEVPTTYTCFDPNAPMEA